MKGYLLAVAGAIVLSAVVSCIVSDGKMGKFVKGMSRIFVFSVLLVPLLSLFSKKDFSFSAADVGEDVGYLVRCAELLEEQDEEEIARLILDEFPLELRVNVEREAKGGFPLKKISVKLYDTGLTEEGEHIHILSRTAELLKEKYGFEPEVVWQERE